MTVQVNLCQTWSETPKMFFFALQLMCKNMRFSTDIIPLSSGNSKSTTKYLKIEPPRGKTNNVVSEQVQHKPACTSTEKSQKLEISDLSRENFTIRVAKTKALISFAVTVKLICVFVFAYADCWFSNEVAHLFIVILAWAIWFKS